MNRLSALLRSYSAHGRHSMLIALGDLFISLMAMISSISNLYSEPFQLKDFDTTSSFNLPEDEGNNKPHAPVHKKIRGECVLIFVVALIAATFAVFLGIGILKRSSRWINVWIIANMIIISIGFIFLVIGSFAPLELFFHVVLQGCSAVIYRSLQCWSVQEYFWEISTKRAILIEERNSLCINCENGASNVDIV